MIELIGSLFKEGDFIRLFFCNSSRTIEGNILKILPSSIAIKSVDGKICGVKGDEIDSFDSGSTMSSTDEDEFKEQTLSTGSLNPSNVISQNEDSNKVEIEGAKLEFKTIVQTPKQELKPGDVIPLEELQRRMGTQSRLQSKKKKWNLLGGTFESLSSLVKEEHAIDNQKIVPALGSIKWLSGDGRPFGCILDGKENVDLYFSFSQITDPNLLKNIRKGSSVVYTKVLEPLGPKAKFIHSPGKIKDILNLAELLVKSGDLKSAIGVLKHILNEYPDNFDAEKLLKELGDKVPYRLIRDTTSTELYQKAKRLYDSKKYDEAIDAYKDAIKANHKRESAVKDLGMLYLFLCNQTESEDEKEKFRLEAIDFMEENSKYLPQNTVTWSYLENFYYSVREFEKFDFVTDKLLSNKQVQSESQRYVLLLNKKAASFLRRGNKKRAKEYIEKSLEIYPKGSAVLKLLSIIENDNVDIETVFSASEFETLTSGLSQFIQETLDQYEEYHGVPSKIIESGHFTTTTLKDIRRLIDTAGRSRARERAKYLLTEGKLMLTIEPDNILRLRSVMARFCNAMALNHIFESSSMDIIRFYYIEAFSLEEKLDATIRQIPLYLLTHIYNYSQLLNVVSQNTSLDDALSKFLFGDVDIRKWESILSMFLYNREITAAITSKLYANPDYFSKAKVALSNYNINLPEAPSKDDFVSAWNKIREQRIRDYKHTVTSILSYKNFSSLEEVCISLSSNLRDERRDWMCALDLSRLTSIINNICNCF